MRKNTKAAYARKDTFWNKERVEKKLTFRELSEIIGESDKRLAGYFSGYLLPKDATIRQLCDLFDVDYSIGNLEFQHAHRQYKAEHKLGVAYSSKKKSTTSNKKVKKNTPISTVEDVLEILYNNISCAEFIEIYKALTGVATDINPLKVLYGVIPDYETYYNIVKIIKGTGDGVIE